LKRFGTNPRFNRHQYLLFLVLSFHNKSIDLLFYIHMQVFQIN
jgi:hypothetical protein